MNERVINIDWTGPHKIGDVQTMNGPTDKGLYQVYGHHPIYGPSLVYIGKTTISFSERPFYVREEDRWESGSENDPKKVEYYLGRLIGDVTPSPEDWNRDIGLAEALLIHAHSPAYNSQLSNRPTNVPDCKNVRVLNWGAVRSLHREVSGMFWMTKVVDIRKLYRLYGDAPTQPLVVPPVLTG